MEAANREARRPVEYPALSADAARIAGLDGADRQADPVWVVAPDPGPEDEGTDADEAPERDEPAVEVQ